MRDLHEIAKVIDHKKDSDPHRTSLRALFFFYRCCHGSEHFCTCLWGQFPSQARKSFSLSWICQAFILPRARALTALLISPQLPPPYLLPVIHQPQENYPIWMLVGVVWGWRQRKRLGRRLELQCDDSHSYTSSLPLLGTQLDFSNRVKIGCRP